MIHEVLYDREIEIQGAGLKHDAKNAQCLPGGMLHIVVKDPDATALRPIEPGNQCKECALACAIEAEQHGKCRWCDIECHLIERAPCAIGMTDRFNRKHRYCHAAQPSDSTSYF